MKKRLYKVFITVAVVYSQSLSAGQFLLESGVQQNTLIELYTSEGCSSCPPAERKLNEFRTHAQLWKDFIPVAFHVDYWDYIGWKDRFAKPAYGQRQRQYAILQRNRTVYTPAFFVNGQSWRPGWFSEEHPPLSKAEVGNLRLNLDKNSISASFNPHGTYQGQYRLNLAFVGMGLSSNITAGENEGRQSAHEFVVLHHLTTTPGQQWQISWPQFDRQQARQLGIAAWVSRDNSPVPIQATGMLLGDELLTKFK